jgi:hypothetical protein
MTETPVTEEMARERDEGLRRAIRALTIMVAVFTATTLIVGSLLAIQIRGQNKESRNARVALIDNTNQIKDCTDPQGECARQNAQRLAASIELLTRYQAVSLACATTLPLGLDIGQKIASVNKCVKANLGTALPPGGGGN